MTVSPVRPSRHGPLSTRDSNSVLVSYPSSKHTELTHRSGGKGSRRTFIGGSALATLVCNFAHCSIPAAVAASTAEDRVAAQGDEILVEYTSSFEDGTVFEKSGEQPRSLIVGGGQIGKGFDDALRGMKMGERKKVIIQPEDAYGRADKGMIFLVPKEQVPPGLAQGQRVGIGQGMSALVAEVKTDGSIMLDANSPFAGKAVVFDAKVVKFKGPQLQGIDMVGWQGHKIQVPFGREASPVSKVFEKPKWPAAWPYRPDDFKRQDESTDNQFYNEPRFVTHIDNGFIGAIKSFYDLQFSQAPQGDYSVLDICSSWISHYPEKLGAKRVAITGMNEAELKANTQATEYIAKDLNIDPKLPFGDSEFDFVTNVVSVDYLNKPREIFSELHRVMKPGGVAIMSFSNRCFPTKAISMWVANMNDGPGHCQIVGNYFRFNPEGGWKDISSVDISPNPGRSDPVWVVTAVKA